MSTDLPPSNEGLIQLEVKLDRLCNGIDHLRDKQEEMAEDIAKIKEAVYNPDEGLYARTGLPVA